MLATSATRAPLLIGTWSGHGEVVRVGGAWPRAIAIIATSATKTQIAAALIGLGATAGIGTASNDCQPTFISRRPRASRLHRQGGAPRSTRPRARKIESALRQL
jgi:hypothetical protein